MMEVVAQISKLKIGYGDKAIVENLDFRLQKAELIGVVGINGIGKSTLLRTLGNFQPKLSGSIVINGQELDSLTQQALSRQIGVVLTEPIATKNLSVTELIALGRQPYTNWIGRLGKEDLQKIQECIEIFELEALKEKKCHELSDGQLQRVLIARAMAQDTPLVLLDEPTTHLDLFHKVKLLKLLQQMADQHNKSIVFSTHEINLAIEVCDKILILDGKDNPFGTATELIKAGHFEQLFPSDSISFDSSSRSFKIRK